MKKLESKHDHLIEEFIKDSRYKITKDGFIFSMINSEVTRLIGRVHDSTNSKTNSKCYRKIKYKGKELKVNRIIYRKFKGRLKKNMVINHIDGNSLNDHHLNLEQIVQKENIIHRYKKRSK